MRDGGKGSAPRPLSVPMEEFDNAWDRIFSTSKVLREHMKEVNQEFDKEYEKYKND